MTSNTRHAEVSEQQWAFPGIEDLGDKRPIRHEQLFSAQQCHWGGTILWGVESKPALASPMINNKPFTVIWNAPTENCKAKYDVDSDLSPFDVVENKNEIFMGNKITIFYKDKLGLYPYYTQEGTPVNGGLVQNASLPRHLEVAKEDIDNLVDQDFSGLAVVGWEEWRPLWVRNWGSMDIYRKKSNELEKSKDPSLPDSEILQIAKKKFQTAAENFMRQTLKVGQTLRPKGCWGFYKFPECYNYIKDNTQSDYTGQCPEEVIPRNNQLAWLWKASQCLYPNIYIPQRVEDSTQVQKFVHYRVKEALRVAALGRSSEALPVLVYARYSYIKTLDFLSEIDLVHTIGESAAIGASGVVLWGNMDFAHTRQTCMDLKNYIDKQLGTYVLNITRATMLCSKVLCNGNGRCVRKDPESRAYLHIDPKFNNVISDLISTGSVQPHEEFHSEALNSMKEQFKCQCYKGGMGPNCEAESNF
ncbi:hyaluronidase-1-like [Carcharodon carcharias]|uniref:hyaluronidase-1-like n=1 Tax=Carcharodon carcharias TaxID=13397 RepID=UPI001B7EAFA8|nr:hyaluronidase-1-like [Carcharodon carcharias]